MDTTETYIKMRRKAIPDLGMGEPPSFSTGAEVVWHTTFVCTDIKGDFYYSDKDEGFQLERQDQLQEMVPTQIGSTQPNYKMISELNHFHDYWDTNGIPNNLTSWEQLWLAFVMKEKGKVWNGEDWHS